MDKNPSKNPAYFHVLRSFIPMLLIVFLIVLSVVFQPKSATNSQLHSRTTTLKKTVTNHEVTKAPAPTPKATPPVATAAPTPVVPAKTTSPVVTKGTKPEPVVTPSPSSSVSGLTPVSPTPPSSSPTPAASQPQTSSYTSTNWSGYLAASSSYTSVSGSWTATSPTGNGSSTSADATWIGIGGVTSGDLIQVGTQNTVSASGQVSSAAFYEMLPSASRNVPGITVTPGDRMTANINETSSGQWTISITDDTNQESFSTNVAYSSSLSSAEWIEEDPSYISGRQVPFDNFGSAAFTSDSTIASGSSLNLVAASAQPITMVNQANQTIAMPSAIGGDGASFSISP